MTHNITIVTAASSNHFRCLNNLLWSINEREPRARVIIYDIGLSDEERTYLPSFVRHGELRKFDFTKYPAHFKLSENSGRMAFRPVIVHEVAKELGGIVLWLDAGCILTSGLQLFLLAVKKYGIISPTVPSKLQAALHHSTHAALRVIGDRLQKPMRDAGISCFDTSQPKVMQFIEHWRDVALNPTLTAPHGSEKRTHRQDAVFAALILESGLTPPPMFPHLPIMSHQDHVDLRHLKLFFSRPWFLKPESEWPAKPKPLPPVQPLNQRGYSTVIKTVARSIAPKVKASIPFDKWPDYIKEIAAKKIEGERGAGDTVERVVGKFGSAEFRIWYAERAGVMAGQCKCENWLPIWNSKYRYGRPVAPATR